MPEVFSFREALGAGVPQLRPRLTLWSRGAIVRLILAGWLSCAANHWLAQIYFDVAAFESFVWNHIRHQHSTAEIENGCAGWDTSQLKLTSQPVILDMAW